MRISKFRRLVGSALAVFAAVTLGATLATPGHATPATPALGPVVSGYASYDPQDTCDPSNKPGPTSFKDLLVQTYGSRSWNIGRSCSEAGTSEHKEGRALDFAFDVNNATQRAEAYDLINWLFATDQYGNTHAVARHLGLMYIIWDRKLWGSYNGPFGEQTYSCDGTPSGCHTNHIHFSFSWSGAWQQTTWWTGQTNRQAYEASSANGWQNLPTGISGVSAIAVMSVGTTKYVYTLVNGGVYEASSTNGWQNLPTGISGVSAIAVMSVGTTKYVYTLVNGGVYEASSANGWQNLPTGISGVSAIAVMSVGTTKYVYTLVNGGVYEASSANGWQNLPTGISGVSAIAVMSVGTTKYVYTLVNGGVYEASSANGWQNLPTGISGVSAIAVMSVGTTKYVYTLVNGSVYEASSTNGWQNLPTGISGASIIAAISIGTTKYIYNS